MDKYTTWQLAGMADCASPDRHDGIGFDHPTEPAEGSAGADFLRRVARDVAERLEEMDTADDLDDMACEVADGCVPIYTHDLWATFVDLAAWQEDVGELAGDETDMDKLARVALYVIGARLAHALIGDAKNEDEEMDA